MRQNAEGNDGGPARAEPRRIALRISPSQCIDIVRGYRDYGGRICDRTSFHIYGQPRADFVLQARTCPRRLQSALPIAGIMEIEHVGNADLAVPNRPEQEQRKL